MTSVDKTGQYTTFRLDEHNYALRLSFVQRVVHAVEVTPLPKAPDTVLGIINVHGQVIPVFNTRKRFGLPEKEIGIRDQLVIANSSKRTVALLVDSAGGVIECSEQEVVSDQSILPAMEYIEGVIKLKDGMVIIHNLDSFLSLEEEKNLDKIFKNLQQDKNG